ESDRLPLGIFYRRPPLEQLPGPPPKPFDTQAYLNRFRV
ncbi:MAG: 2-oxoacid ferredoxin oxidoreductase, partial [Chloroflexus aggregans]